MNLNKYICLPLVLLLTACSGQRPNDLGVNEGRFVECPDSPNCVSSFSTTELHQVEPLKAVEGFPKGMEKISKIISNYSNSKIIDQTERYIHAEFTSTIFKFVDDLEVYFPEGSDLIHIKSRSRLGHSDLGVNRERVEEIRFKYIQNDY